MSIVVKSLEQIIADITARFVAAYGTDLDTSPTTPDGQLISNISESFYQLYQLLQAVYDASKALECQGDAMDDLYFLNNILRKQGTRSLCHNAILTGTNGTVIPAGSQANSTSGNVFFSAFDVTISGTTATVDFVAADIGPIKCAAGQLNVISTPVTGWTAINNPTDAIIGQDVELDAVYRGRFLGLIGQYSMGYVGTIKALILAVIGVNDAYVYNNDTSAIGPSPWLTPAGSLAILVDYSDSTIENAIAQAIFGGKPPVALATITGGTLVTKTITDASGHGQTINFYRAVKTDVYIKIILTQTSQTGTDIEAQIKTIISNYINIAAKIGRPLIYTKVVGTVSNLDERIQIESFYIATHTPPISTDIVDVIPAYDQILISNPANISITVNVGNSEEE